MKTKSTTLLFKDSKSDKQYNVSLEKSGKQFIVNFAYGKRGGNLKEGTKTKVPIAYDKAKIIYEKLVKSKTDKGYVSNENSDKSVKKKATTKSQTKTPSKAKSKTTSQRKSKTDRSKQELFDELLQLIDNEKEILPILKTLSDQEKKAMTPLIKQYINGLVTDKLKGRKEHLVHQLGFFFLTLKEILKTDWTLHDLAYELPKAIMDILPFYKPDWFDEKMKETSAPYDIWIKLDKQGYINLENFENQIADAFSSFVFGWDEKYNTVVTYDNLFNYKETLSNHIYMVLRNPHNLYQGEDDKGTTWQSIFLKLVDEKKIDREKIFDNIYLSNILRVRDDFRNSSKMSKTDSSYYIKWNFELVEVLKPTQTEIIRLQDQMITSLQSPYSEAITTNIKLLNQVVDYKDFDYKACLKGLSIIISKTNVKQTKVILDFMKTLLTERPELKNNILTVAKEGLKNIDKVQKYIKPFLEKTMDLKEQEMDEFVSTEKEKQAEAAKPKKADFAGLDPETIEKVSRLLLSVEDASTKVAFAILENQEFPKVLLTEVFAIYKLTDDVALKQTALEIITKHGSAAVQKQLKSKLSLGFGNVLNPPTEKTIKKNIIKYVKDNELYGLKLAQALYKKYGLGVAYLLEESPEDEQEEMFRSFLNGTVLKLQDKALVKFPPAIFKFPELTEIDLSDNKLAKIPKEIKIFKKLKVLNLSGNNLKTIDKNIKELQALEELYLNKNYMKKAVPKELFELKNLRKLDLTGIQDRYKIFDLPENIANLKKMEWFKLDDNNGRQHHDSYSNYPQIEEVKGKPLDMNPLAIAETAFDQGDLSPTAYILKHGDDRLIKKVLDYFYDKKTKVFDFKSQYINILPPQILEYEVHILNLDGTNMGSDKWPRYTESVAEDIVKTEILSKLTKLKELNLHNCGLAGLANLSSLQHLVTLNISNNNIGELFDIEVLEKLENLDVSNNHLFEVPQSIFKLPNLKFLKMRNSFKLAKEIRAEHFKNLKTMKSLKHFSTNTYEFRKDKEAIKIIESFIPKGCEHKISEY